MDQGAFVPDATYLQSECRVDESSDNAGWYVHDGLGSVVAEVGEADQNNNPVKCTRKYDVYGTVRSASGSSDSQHKFAGSLGHTTEPDTGDLIYMRARWYDPWTGRFVSEDPAENEDNWYAYCDNDPVNAIDNSGQEKIRISKDFWVRWDEGKSHVHWGNGNVEMGAAMRDGTISHKFRFKSFPSNSEMKDLKRAGIKTRAARMAYDTITAAFQQNPFFVIGLFLDIAGDFNSADQFYRAGGIID